MVINRVQPLGANLILRGTENVKMGVRRKQLGSLKTLTRPAINCAIEIQLRKSTVCQCRQLSGANMSLSLVEALSQTELGAGRTYRCEVKGQLVELRVLGSTAVRHMSAYDESDVMLDPWVELPQPAPMFSVVGEFGPIALPDVPEIPDDGDGDGA